MTEWVSILSGMALMCVILWRVDSAMSRRHRRSCRGAGATASMGVLMARSEWGTLHGDIRRAVPKRNEAMTITRELIREAREFSARAMEAADG